MEYSKKYIGFSTGSIAPGNIKLAIEILKEFKIRTIELSTLRESEFIEFMEYYSELDLKYFKYVSIHAPSKLVNYKESELVENLIKISLNKWYIIVHPDIISDFNLWNQLGEYLCLENMDKRKNIGRNYIDMEYLFSKLPKASFCFDIAHAKQVDQTMNEGLKMILKYKSRLKQIHLSTVNSASKHELLNWESMTIYKKTFGKIVENYPVILETPIDIKTEIKDELKKVAKIF